jgi:hypothetical protein
MAQQIAVVIIVLGATLYSAWSLMPAGWRRGAAASLGARVRGWGVAEGQAARIEQALASSSGCSDCSSCKACATPASPSAGGAQRVAVIAMPEKFAGRRQA